MRRTGSLLGWNLGGHAGDQSGGGDDVEQIAVEPERDLLADKPERKLQQLSSEADHAVARDGSLNLDDARAAFVDQRLRGRLGTGRVCAVLDELDQVACGVTRWTGPKQVPVPGDVDAAIVRPDGDRCSCEGHLELQLLLASWQPQPAVGGDDVVPLDGPDVALVLRDGASGGARGSVLVRRRRGERLTAGGSWRSTGGRTVTVIIEEHLFRVLDGDTEISTHPRTAEAGTSYRINGRSL
ncbi:hypothetical protein [Glycomyces sp. MUSA5-2]|uniref:hypothetical protein n=1 Tax=Glycomyces sp. MUSA5-2 TaxID=2053002 RepID=UPI003009ABF2